MLLRLSTTENKLSIEINNLFMGGGAIICLIYIPFIVIPISILLILKGYHNIHIKLRLITDEIEQDKCRLIGCFSLVFGLVLLICDLTILVIWFG